MARACLAGIAVATIEWILKISKLVFHFTSIRTKKICTGITKKALVIGVCLGFTLTNCFKYTSEPKQPEERILNGRVVEYGSGLPIAGANFSYSFCTRAAVDFGCAETESETIVTDADGSLPIPAQSITSLLFPLDYYAFRKEGYWENAKGESLPYGSDFPYPIFFPNNSGGDDSFHVELFPIVTIRIHAKNISPDTRNKLLPGMPGAIHAKLCSA
jgi:hypothetical protein